VKFYSTFIFTIQNIQIQLNSIFFYSYIHSNNQGPNNNAVNNTNNANATTIANNEKHEKYNRKYNLISFILLRKNDEYLSDTMLNDQILYERVDGFVAKADLAGLTRFFTETPALAAFVNAYNSSLFVYTIRKCLETNTSTETTATTTKKEDLLSRGEFTHRVMEFLFSKSVRPASFYYLIDGDYPKRNLVHYAARYNSVRILELIRDSLEEELDERDSESSSSAAAVGATSKPPSKAHTSSQDLLLQVRAIGAF
jgi:hypothetical protein